MCFDQIDDEAIALARRLGHVDDEAEDVDLGDRVDARCRPCARSCGAAAGECPACRERPPARRDSSSRPRIRVLVVCGLSETMASLVPTIRLSSVDLPAFGRPMNETNPAFMTSAGWRAPDRRCRRALVVGRDRLLADPDFVDSPALGVEDLDGQAVDLERARRPPGRGRCATAGSRRPSRTPRARSRRAAAARTSSMFTLPLKT